MHCFTHIHEGNDMEIVDWEDKENRQSNLTGGRLYWGNQPYAQQENHKHISRIVAKTDSAWEADAYGRSMLPLWMQRKRHGLWILSYQGPYQISEQ